MTFDGSVIKTPWNCEQLYFLANCMMSIVEKSDKKMQCPKELVICCYFCKHNEKCCDRCPHLVVTELD